MHFFSSIFKRCSFVLMIFACCTLGACGGCSNENNFLQHVTDQFVQDKPPALTVKEQLTPNKEESSSSVPLTVSGEKLREILGNTMNHREEYELLSAPEQDIYLSMLNCILQSKESAIVPCKNKDTINEIYLKMASDFPEIFYIETYTLRFAEETEFTPTYLYSFTEIAEQESQMIDSANEILATIPEGLSKYETLTKLYAALAEHITYTKTEHDQTLYGALVEGKAVCAGYAASMDYLLRLFEIPCRTISGTATLDGMQQPHAWNIVYFNDDPYYLDLTWGDVSLEHGGDALCYDYLCAPTALLAQTHIPDEMWNAPLCTATNYQYYRTINAYLETSNPDAVKKVFAAQLPTNNTVTFQCSSNAVFQQILTDTFESGDIFPLLREIDYQGTSFSYITNEITLCVTCYLD